MWKSTSPLTGSTIAIGWLTAIMEGKPCLVSVTDPANTGPTMEERTGVLLGWATLCIGILSSSADVLVNN